jgi:putative transposase
VKNHCLAKSINDAGWYQFRKWLECFGVKFGRITVAVNPALTSQECSSCGTVVKKSLSVRTHVCQCGFVLDRDGNAAINILNKALSTTKHTKQFWVRLVFETADPAQVESGESQNRQNVSTKC